MKVKFYRYFLLPVVLTFFIVFRTAGQQDSLYTYKEYKPRFKDHLYLGGSLGLQIGTVTVIEVSPLAMYNITPRLFTGIGGTYIYYNDIQFQPNYTTNIYGGRVLLNYTVIWNIFLHAEYELLNYQPFSLYQVDTKRIFVNDWLVGVGFRQWIGTKSFMFLSLLWNLNETPNSPYVNPIIRVGIGFGL
jgi:hypothetical protein